MFYFQILNQRKRELKMKNLRTSGLSAKSPSYRHPIFYNHLAGLAAGELLYGKKNNYKSDADNSAFILTLIMH